MPTMQELQLVREVAEDYLVSRVELRAGEIAVFGGGGGVQYYSTAEEAIADIRATFVRRNREEEP